VNGDSHPLRTLSSELAHHAARISGQPRVYADANIPAGLVEFLRTRLRWDVLFVLEHEDLRRLRDTDHYRLAHQLGRTLLTLDRDYLDDRRFPPSEGSGVLVMSAPNEFALMKLVSRLDRKVFRPRGLDEDDRSALPLAGRKLSAHPDWRE
jgi:hypothetical protein